MTTEQQRDEQLWQMAKARAAFKSNLFCYLIVNAFLVVLWFFIAGPNHYFWPIWPLLGWGLGLAFQYFNAYHGSRMVNAQDEYKKLIKEQGIG